MLVAEQLGAFEDGVSRRRHGRRRSRRSRFLRDLRRGWRRTRIHKSILSLILAAGAVVAGYWASMYVARQDLPDTEQLGVVPRGK